ncbi:hypothetical protein [Streptomyces sp. NPDC088146]|uniref:hypothetical protein n=1 Tax=Streptomyces sp. NPDC088146 TaxID=3365829 RepID=UPI0037FA9923
MSTPEEQPNAEAALARARAACAETMFSIQCDARHRVGSTQWAPPDGLHRVDAIVVRTG